MTGVLLRNAEVDGRAGVDLRLRDGRIAEIGPSLDRRGEDELDCRGGAALPGLWDAHLHLLALAAADRSVLCGPPAVDDRAALAAALGAAAADPSGWVRGVGYIETVAGDLDATALDRLHAVRPVRMQHRSGALWMLNSAAIEWLRLAGTDAPGIERDGAGRPTGRLWRSDAELRRLLPQDPPPDLRAVGDRLTRLGITAVTDATPDLAPEALAAVTDAMKSGALPQRVQFLGVPLDQPAPGVPGASVGPYKIVIADSALPGLDDLAARIAGAHAAGRPVAVHCVTRAALVLLLAALDVAGPLSGDRIEHAALVPEELVPDLARRGLTVVTQPGFLAHRGEDYLDGVPEDEHRDLYRCRSLLSAGVPLALSSDAPYGPLDPWAVIEAAVTRRTAAGRVVAGDERLDPRQALAAYLADPAAPGTPRRIRTGAVADVVLLDRPSSTVLAGPDAGAVRAVLIGGRLRSGT
ncbi:amidohydrolase family protein [Blastococcus sp. CT_GayMR16]|uniref:amidohydrolase family protein n=1 Tax=Blastococcus sp. CT_GayMR16 TaxID=2559607 RepID=UPI00107408A9|nr:amidohydrolase family protein [Blastococcus sp. CT_GayMR16]TFV88863.1 amidohydrolase [Blastococcus sp. CT_GayMR16]